jgi:hypothetical protein
MKANPKRRGIGESKASDQRLYVPHPRLRRRFGVTNDNPEADPFTDCIERIEAAFGPVEIVETTPRQAQAPSRERR